MKTKKNFPVLSVCSPRFSQYLKNKIKRSIPFWRSDENNDKSIITIIFSSSVIKLILSSLYRIQCVSKKKTIKQRMRYYNISFSSQLIFRNILYNFFNSFLVYAFAYLGDLSTLSFLRSEKKIQFLRLYSFKHFFPRKIRVM